MNLRKEREIWRKGYKLIIGLDEAGRGPLAGPVFAAGIAIISGLEAKGLRFLLKEVNDSKKLSAKKRDKIYRALIDHSAIAWGIGRAGPKVIDRINILEATKLAMIRAVRSLEGKLGRKADFLILDGNFQLKLSTAQQSIIRGDEKIFSCGAASIIAKVSRDRTMKRYGKVYSQYGFAQHKGYPTKHHRRMLKKFGPCKIHRKSFKPLRKT